jgi:hypothetical protein
MIVCPICQRTNSHLAVTCASCGGFLQAKVDNLDLFATTWRVIEFPRRAFHRIAIASHKNYVFFLSALLGIGEAFMLLWLFRIGNSNLHFLEILAIGFLAGPPLGIATVLVMASSQKLLTSIFGLRARFFQAMGIISYAAIPIVASVILILPIKLLTFGKYFFSSNPTPMLIKPASYVLLLSLDAVFIVYSITLYVAGIRCLYDVGTGKALAVAGGTLAIVLALATALVLGLAESLGHRTLHELPIAWQSLRM